MNLAHLFLFLSQTLHFQLPPILEVFPELKLPWPKWVLRNHRRLPCKKDSDCPFPATCCVHPLLPGEKQCCTGFGNRALVKKYILGYIPPNAGEQSSERFEYPSAVFLEDTAQQIQTADSPQ